MAKSEDAINFTGRELFFAPEYGYEAYGCEDPRITKLKGEYYIFYTAVANMPPRPSDVRLALARTRDFKSYEKLGIVCPFNSKAGCIFPRKIRGQYCMIFTLYPDVPPSKLALAYFDRIDELFSQEFWQEWIKYLDVEDKTVKFNEPRPPLVELGSPPIETSEGWLLFAPDIIYERGQFLEFRITALLLDLENPSKPIAQAKEPLLVPSVAYECMARAYPLTKIAMPTGAIVKDGVVYVYYGASDLFCCVAYCELEKLISWLVRECKL